MARGPRRTLPALLLMASALLLWSTTPSSVAPVLFALAGVCITAAVVIAIRSHPLRRGED